MKFLFASLLLIGSFAQASDLEIKIGPVAVTALPIAMASCTDVNSSTSLAKAVVNFTLFKFAWKGQNTFMAQYAVLEIEGTALSSSKYGGFITGNELNAAMAGHTTILGGDSTVYTSTCGLRFGGISFKDAGSSAIIEGTVTIHGLEVDADGNSTPISVSEPVTINYDGEPGA